MSTVLVHSDNSADECMVLSIQSADVSLCVLSAPEVIVGSPDSGSSLNIPPTVAPLLKEDTILLLNKIDLLPSSVPLPSSPFPATWGVSLGTGRGTQTFMKQFGETLRQR